MSAQTIIENTDNKISTQVNSFLAEEGKKYLLNKRFEIGESLSYKQIRMICRLSKIFCEDKCHINEEDMTLIKENINKMLIYNNG